LIYLFSLLCASYDSPHVSLFSRFSFSRLFPHPQQDQYYRVSSWVSPASVLAWQLALAIRRSRPDNVWLAVLGLTDALLQERLLSADYEALAELFTTPIEGFRERRDVQRHSDDPFGDAYGTGGDGGGTLLSVPVPGSISRSSELKFHLLRHWTLYDAMANAKHVATHLRIWTEQGTTELRAALARMRIPLAEARESYTLMKESVKASFRTHLDAFGQVLGLVDNEFPSFVRQHSSALLVSAADMVLALAALLETKPGTLPAYLLGRAANSHAAASAGIRAAAARAAARADGLLTEGTDGDASLLSPPSAAAAAAAGGPAGAAPSETLDSALRAPRQAFWMAYDALAPQTGIDTLRLGLALAVDVQCAIVRQGVAMVKKREIDMRALVHYAIVDSSPDLAIFSRPAALARLASFVLDLIALKKVSRPLVIAILIPAADAYLVLGANGLRNAPTRRGANAFGTAFRAAAAKVRARVRHDGFDASIVYVQRADLKKLIHQLIFVVTASVSLQV
jgi:cell division control protein 45